MIARRICPSSYVDDLDRLIALNYPMFDNFMSVMIEEGIYQVQDEKTGRIMQPSEALGLLKSRKNDN